jgi:chromosome segregation ATPase
MALTGKLSALASQLAAVQEENDTIRGRYLELEDAWQGMIDENKAVHQQNGDLKLELEAERGVVESLTDDMAELEHQVQALQAENANASAALSAAQEELKAEQLMVGNANVQADTLRRESMNLDVEGRKLRQSWEEKVYNLKKAEEDRDHFKAELHQLAEQYAQLVDDLSFCVLDYQVKTSSTQVLNRDGKYELLASYLNRIYDAQETTNDKYKKLGAINRPKNYIDASVPERLVPAVLSPNANTNPAADQPSVANAVSWTEAHRQPATTTPLSPNGRMLRPTPEGARPGWNKY